MRTVARILLISILIGILINVPFVAYDIYRDVFRADAFDRLEVGTSKASAIDILEARKVWCELLDGKSSACHFSDYWRDYTIFLDPSTATITQRSYRDRYRHSFLRFVVR